MLVTEGGYRRFLLTKKSAGNVVAAAGHYAEGHRIQEAATGQNGKVRKVVGHRRAPEGAAEWVHDDQGSQEWDDEGSFGIISGLVSAHPGPGKETH